MKVVLQETVNNVGYVGDVLEVANGYARNYLLPKGLALVAHPRNVKALEHAKRITAHKAKKIDHELKQVASVVSKVSLSFAMQTGKDDKLFGSVTAKDIETALLAEGFEVNRHQIQLPHPIKELGTLIVPIKLHRDIVAKVTVSVVKKGHEDVAMDAEPSVPRENVDREAQPEE